MGKTLATQRSATPPANEEHVIAPERYLAGELAIEVSPPVLREGEEELDRNEFGMLTLLIVLGERLGFVDAWARGRWLGRRCVRLVPARRDHLHALGGDCRHARGPRRVERRFRSLVL